MKKIFDPNFTKNKYFDQCFNGKVISNSYDRNTHFNIVRLSDYKKVYLEDLKIIVLIKNGDSLSKQKDKTYFTVFKKDNSQIIYDMYNKNLRVIK